MPSTDRHIELKAKTSMAQTASQAAVYVKGIISVILNPLTFILSKITNYDRSCIRWHCYKTNVLDSKVNTASLKDVWLLNNCLVNLYEPCVLYIGQTRRYPPNTPFYIFFQQIYVLNFLIMLHILRFFLFKIPFISECYHFWFLYYSHFTYRVC
jgi:hypothetical protein